MSLPPGARFGAYELAEPIGAGGMGEVYRATDTELKRDVAIKVLPDALAGDADRLARFRREAELLAQLNHPNIAHVYGLERGEGRHALAMELVEGPTLAERIARGPIPVDEALGIASQIAAALEAAHARGIIHRDLKPANVKLRPDGTVKVLDFGIAKALDSHGAASGRQYPSLTTPAMTEAGIALGTAAYMSPEQARGRPVDKRTDVWAFGCVLYEMLTGQPAFTGEDVTTTIARVLERELDTSTMPETVSPLVRNTLGLCLQKNPDQRIHDIGDVELALAGAFDVRDAPTSASPRASASLMRRSLLPAAMLLAGVGIAAAAAWRLRPSVEPAPVVRFADHVEAGIVAAVAVSRDGSRVAYVSGEPAAIQVRSIGDLVARPVVGTSTYGVFFPPCFSPGNDWLAFSANNGRELWKIPVAGGTALPLARGLDVADQCDWADDGYIYFGTTPGIMRVPEVGGAVETVAAPDKAAGEIDFEAPHLLPGGDALLLTSLAEDGYTVDVVIQDLKTGERTTVLEDAGMAVYVPTGPRPELGHLLYSQGNTLFAAPFNLATLEAGSSSPVLQGISSLGPLSWPGVSESGMLAYWYGVQLGSRLAWLGRDGTTSALPEPVSAYGDLMFDAKRERVAWVNLDATSFSIDLWIYEFSGGPRRLTFDGTSGSPVWRSDGSIIYSNSYGPPAEDRAILSVPADGSAPAATLARIAGVTSLVPTSISSDGSVLVGMATQAGRKDNDVWMLALDQLPDANDAERVAPTYLLDSGYDESHPSLSPDARYIAYSSNESGQNEIYVQPFPGPGARVKVSSSGGRQPRWSDDGRTVYYIDGNRLIAAEVDTAEGFKHGAGTSVISSPGLSNDATTIGRGFKYDVGKEGERFLVIQPTGPGETAELRFKLNWFGELRRLAPYPESW